MRTERGYVQLGIAGQYFPKQLLHFGIMLLFHQFEIIETLQGCCVPDILKSLAVKGKLILAPIDVGDGSWNGHLGLRFGLLRSMAAVSQFGLDMRA